MANFEFLNAPDLSVLLGFGGKELQRQYTRTTIRISCSAFRASRVGEAPLALHPARSNHPFFSFAQMRFNSASTSAESGGWIDSLLIVSRGG